MINILSWKNYQVTKTVIYNKCNNHGLSTVFLLTHYISYVILYVILGGSVHTVKKNIEAFVAATKEIGLEVNADKTKYMTVCRD